MERKEGSRGTDVEDVRHKDSFGFRVEPTRWKENVKNRMCSTLHKCYSEWYPKTRVVPWNCCQNFSFAGKPKIDIEELFEMLLLHENYSWKILIHGTLFPRSASVCTQCCTIPWPITTLSQKGLPNISTELTCQLRHVGLYCRITSSSCPRFSREARVI